MTTEIITNPETQQALYNAYKEWGVAQSKIELYKGSQKDVADRMKDEHNIKVSDFNRDAKMFHAGKDKYEESVKKRTIIETNFENVIGDKEFI